MSMRLPPSLPTIAAAAALGPIALLAGGTPAAGAASTKAHASRVKEYCATVVVHHHPERKCVTRGPRGRRGTPGAAGPRGFTGPAGPRGYGGKKGEKGAKGDKGEKGPAGSEGKAGPTGPAGPEGKPGPTGPAGGSPASALVTPTASFVGSHPGFASAKLSGTPGVICVAPNSGGVDPTTHPAIVSAEFSYSTAVEPGFAELNIQQTHTGACGAKEYEVDTFSAKGTLSAGIAFVIAAV